MLKGKYNLNHRIASPSRERLIKKKLQVFVSSTWEDLQDLRQTAVEAILMSNHIPAGMELFAAGDEAQMKVIRKWIDDSDVFLLILGGRYGSIESKTGKSYVELEFDYAVKTGKRFFSVIMEEQYLDQRVREKGTSHMERDHTERFKTFKDQIKSKLCSFFANSDQLSLRIVRSLADIADDSSLIGWIHGSEVIDPKRTMEEMEVLREENQRLKHRLATAEQQITGSQQLNLVDSLSANAIELLVTARKSDCQIMYIKLLSANVIQAGQRNFISADDNYYKNEAVWVAAINELLNYGLIEDVGYEGSMFKLTLLGFDTADAIIAVHGSVAGASG